MNAGPPNFANFYATWKQRKPGETADIRRTSTPEELLDLPAFYRLVRPLGWTADLPPWEKERWQRLVFLVDHVENKGKHPLGKALALSDKVNEKRMFQVVRSEWPLDVIQLRRILKHSKPSVDWEKMARQIWHWGKYQKRYLMEDFILSQTD